MDYTIALQKSESKSDLISDNPFGKRTKLKNRKKADCFYSDYIKHSKGEGITLRLIEKKEIILKISNQWENNFYFFKLRVPDQMKATDKKHIVWWGHLFASQVISIH